jgi:hypothetical protein
MTDRIDYDERGDLDDVVVNDVRMFRMERMDSGHFWLRCYRDGKPDVVFALHSTRKIVGSHEVEDDTPPSHPAA